MKPNPSAPAAFAARPSALVSIRRPAEIKGAYALAIERGADGRRHRHLTFTTADGFTGRSARFDRREAYDAALHERAAALSVIESVITLAFALAPHVPATLPKPAPAAPLHAIDDSTLFAEIERRGYEVAVPEAEIDALRADIRAGRLLAPATP